MSENQPVTVFAATLFGTFLGTLAAIGTAIYVWSQVPANQPAAKPPSAVFIQPPQLQVPAETIALHSPVRSAPEGQKEKFVYEVIQLKLFHKAPDSIPAGTTIEVLERDYVDGVMFVKTPDGNKHWVSMETVRLSSGPR